MMFTPLDQATAATPPRGAPGRYRVVCLGLDVGQLHDPSALCAVELTERTIKAADPLFGEWPLRETHFRVLGAERLPLGTSYPDVAARLCLLAKRLYDRDSSGDYHALVDCTGVGRPIVDLLREQVIPQCHVTAVTLTGGARGDPDVLWRQEASIAKAYMVSRLQALLQSGRITAPMDPDMAAMAAELKTFELRAKADTGHLQSGAFVVGSHDDLVTSLALACLVDLQEVRYGVAFGDLPSAVL